MEPNFNPDLVVGPFPYCVTFNFTDYDKEYDTCTFDIMLFLRPSMQEVYFKTSNYRNSAFESIFGSQNGAYVKDSILHYDIQLGAHIINNDSAVGRAREKGKIHLRNFRTQ